MAVRRLRQPLASFSFQSGGWSEEREFPEGQGSGDGLVTRNCVTEGSWKGVEQYNKLLLVDRGAEKKAGKLK